MLHQWTNDTDGNGTATRVVIFDFRKAFDLIDHLTLVRELRTFDLPNSIVDRIMHFHRDRKQSEVMAGLPAKHSCGGPTRD